MGKIYIISMGTGNPEMLTHKAQRALGEIDIAVGSKRFENLVKVLLFDPKPIVSGTIDFINKNRDKNIGVLVAGDAGFYSLAKSIVKAFGREQVIVIPGISTVQCAFAAIAEPWENALFLSAHGRSAEVVKQAENAERFLILCDVENNPRKLLTDNPELLAKFDLWVMANLTLENEIIHEVENASNAPDDALSCVVGIKKDGI